MIARPRDDSIRHTLFAMGCVAIRALPLPVLLVSLGSLFPDSASDVNRSLSDLTDRLAILLFALGGLRLLCEPNGVAILHFGWRGPIIGRAYSEIGWLVRWWLPLAALVTFMTTITPNVGDAIVPRVALLTAAIMLITYLIRNSIAVNRQTGERWFHGAVNKIRFAINILVSVIALAVILGHVFSVTMITTAFIETIWVGIGLGLLHALLRRWLRVARRRLRFNELLSRQQPTALASEGAAIEIREAELGDISAETLQLVNVGTVTAAVTALFFIWEPLLPAFDALTRVNLWTSNTTIDGDDIVNQITLATLVIVSILVGLTFFAARKLPALVEIMLRSRTSVSSGVRYATSTLLNYSIVGIGIIAALSSLGLQWSQLQWLIAALGVGIGFGLQEIVANFISGLIILFERPIRLGDIVTIGEKDGTVTRIRIRATTIRDWDGKELLVPNKEFITSRLLNWTLSDPQTRIVIPVGIAYGSDVEKALRILTEVVSSHPTVLEDPEPSIFFIGFGDNSLNLVARCFIADMDQRLPTTSDLHTKINQAFNEAGIVIAFPQRDLHLDTTDPIRIAIDELPVGPG